MPRKEQPAKEPEAWALRPWPKQGDNNLPGLYESIGRVLSQWERYDGTLSLLFGAFMGSDIPHAARRAYSAVRTFEGRLDMLRAVTEAYFAEKPNQDLSDQWISILKQATRFSERRNEIAHGSVDHFIEDFSNPPIPLPAQYCLYPSYAVFKKRDLNSVPEYCYTTIELDYFYEQFSKLINPVSELAGAILQERRTASLKKQYARYLASENQDNPNTNSQDI